MRAALGVAAALALLGTLYVGTTITGRGARDAVGEPHRVTSGDAEIVYYRAGPADGPPVVLLASLGRPVSDWNELIAALGEAGFRTLAVESRGIGGSGGGGPRARPSLHALADDVLAVLEATGITRAVHVVGHAFGNRVARTFAADHPERTRSVTLVAAGGGAPIPPEIERALLLSTLSFLPDAVRLPELRLAFFAADSAIPDYWKTGWSFWGAIAQIHAAQHADDAAFFGAGGAPLLVIQAAEDTIAPPEDAGRPLRDAFPERVTLVELPDAGHALLPEQPERIQQELVAFLRRVEGRSPGAAQVRRPDRAERPD